ncbi:hypothetical protein BGW38_003334 [Lunasporangiospora selenospora]|uniref:Uncharacterized protein n=1 Tax=Lunasporangiospora selenospora TaxID=979761 RepID=A0A9P6FRK7_9FUNG|nr:hypothetical protein BGW38_003334 [Lunasporangiospora selenospora]
MTSKMDALATLQQLDDECTTWSNHHAHSCNLLASLLNIARQRNQTLIQLQLQSKKSSSPVSTTTATATHGSPAPKALLASSTLQALIHKQTLEIESVITQLLDSIQTFERVVLAMTTLERQVEAALQKVDPSTFLSAREDASSRLLDTAEISPLDLLDWVSRTRAMYARELLLKRTQVNPMTLTTALDHFDTLAKLQKSWGLQYHIDFGLEQEMVERIKTYRRVREFSTTRS